MNELQAEFLRGYTCNQWLAGYPAGIASALLALLFRGGDGFPKKQHAIKSVEWLTGNSS